jgi:C4-dicarboxylate transporter DctM subunit
MLIVGIVVFVLLIVAIPIGIALSASSAVYILIDPLLEPEVIFRAFFNFISKYSLMAIPLFIYAGYLMERTGLISQLFRFADALVGWLPGGFGVSTIMACVLFASISGSSVASAAAMSVIAIPEMKKRGYPDWLSSGIVAGNGGIAILIPPSIPLVLYGIVTETSIVKLFFAGVIPGLLLALTSIIAVMIISFRVKLPRGSFGLARLWHEFVGALPGLGMPVIILGGLYGGVFTPTEAAAAACGYAMIFGVVTGRAKFMAQLVPITRRALNLTAVILFLVGSVGVFQFLAANLYWPQQITQVVTDWGLTQLGFIFAYMGVLLILGCFVDGVAMILLTVPVIFPIAYALKVDPVHLGVMLTLAVEMSVVTPPVGLNLFAVSGVSKIPITTVIKGSIPFFFADVATLLIVIFVPATATWLPSVLVQTVFK